MKAFLTDGLGCVGSCLLESLLDRGDDVTVLAGPDAEGLIPQRDRVAVVTCSLEDREAVAEAIDGTDVVFHLAGLVPSIEPGEPCCVDVEGTDVLLGAIAGRVPRVVFASSVAVYRPAPWPFLWPVSEGYPLATDGPEDHQRDVRSVIDAEAAVRCCHEEHGTEYVILRSTEVYGPGLHHAEQLIRDVMANPRSVGRDPRGALGTLMDGNGLARFGAMQWVHVDDLTDAIAQAGVMTAAANEVINVGGEEVFTAQDVAALLWGLLVPGWPAHGSTLLGHYGRKFDIDKAHRLLGYSPQIRLREGLRGLAGNAGGGSGSMAPDLTL